MLRVEKAWAWATREERGGRSVRRKTGKRGKQSVKTEKPELRTNETRGIIFYVLDEPRPKKVIVEGSGKEKGNRGKEFQSGEIIDRIAHQKSQRDQQTKRSGCLVDTNDINTK